MTSEPGSWAALSWLLRLLRSNADAVEADLQRFYGIDYRDRWRLDDAGRRRLTLRRIWVLVKHLPPESAVMTALRDGAAHWTVEAHLLDELRMTLTGSEKEPAKPHPERPQPGRAARRNDPERQRKLAAARKRARDRRRRLAEQEDGERF